MTKQEKIQEVYEKLGFEWGICSKYITKNGVLILPTPDLKFSLKGYESLIKDENKFSSFGMEGLKLQPSELYGISNNNGWTKIESEDDFKMPIDDFYWAISKVDGYIIQMSCYDLKENATHYQPIQKPQPPLY